MQVIGIGEWRREGHSPLHEMGILPCVAGIQLQNLCTNASNLCTNASNLCTNASNLCTNASKLCTNVAYLPVTTML